MIRFVIVYVSDLVGLNYSKDQSVTLESGSIPITMNFYARTV